MKKLLLFVLLALPLASSADYFNVTVGSGQTIQFYLPSGGSAVEVYRPQGTLTGNLVLPSTVEYNGTTYPVTAIANNAFSYCSTLTSVVIPSSITSIGDYAFRGCSGLTSASIPNSVTSIGRYAFFNCSVLTSIVIPDAVTSIGYSAFENCTGLTSVTIGSSVDTIGNYAFDGCSNIATVNYTGDIGGWLSIGFGNWNANPTEITHSLYLNGVEVTELIIPDDVSLIRKNAFNGWTGLTSVVIGNSVTSIGNNAFQSCSNIASVSYTGTIVGWLGISFGSNANPTSYSHGLKINGEEVTELVIPDSITAISDNAFSGWTGLTSVSIGNSVTTIGNSAFYGCTGLTSVSTGNSVTTIGNSAFYGCTGLTSVTIGNNVTSIGDNAFRNCSNIATVNHTGTIADWLGISFGYDANPTIYNHGLKINGEEVTELVIPDGITAISDNAFRGWTGLTSVSIGNSVTTIGSSAFYGCTGLTSVTIGSGVVSIAQYAFYYCNGLSVVTVPNGVQTIGNNAFRGTNMLFYYGTATGSPWGATYLNGVIGDGLYYTIGDDSLYTLHVEANVTSIPNDVLYNKYRSDLVAIEVDAANNTYMSQNGVLWNKAGNTLLRFPPAKQGNLTLGANVTTVTYGALYGCTVDTLFLNAMNCAPQGGKKARQYYANDTILLYQNGISDARTQVHVLEVGEDVDVLNNQFIDLPGLLRINVSEDNWSYWSQDGLLVDEAGYTVLRCPTGRQGAFTFPAGVTLVGEEAFAFFTRLTEVDLSPITHIKDGSYDVLGAFEHCIGLQRITIPATLDTIGSYAFACCYADTLYYNSVDAQCARDAFSSDSLHVVVVGEGVIKTPNISNCHNLVSVQLPLSLRTLGGFSGCTSLSSISLPDSLKEIGVSAFENCTALDSVQMNDALNIIDNYAFLGCTRLKEITITPNVYRIGKLAFGNCDSLKTVYYNAVSTLSEPSRHIYYVNEYLNWHYDTIYYAAHLGGGPFTFRGYMSDYDEPRMNTHIERLIVGEGVRAMYAIWQFGVDTLVLPTTLDTVLSGLNPVQSNLVKFIEKNNYYKDTASNLRYVYFNCKNLRYLNTYSLNTSLHTFESGMNYEDSRGVFPGAANLRHVVFGDSVQAIPSYCFKDCNQVREFINMVLPDNITTLGSGAFEGCTQLKSVVIPESVTSIGVAPFLKCSKLNKITYNAANAEYYGDMSLPVMSRSYSPSSALSYNNVAKANARTSKVSLREWLPPVDTIHIGPNVRSITPGIFSYPYNQVVDTVNYDRITYIDNQSNKIATIGNGAFANLHLANADNLIGDSLKIMGDGAFMNSTGITKAHLPEGCTVVGDAAFRNCQTLDSVWLPSTLELIGTDAFLKDSSLSYLYYNCVDLNIDHSDPESCTPFGNTVSLHGIDFGPDVVYINEGMFKNAEGLERVMLPEGVEWIGSKAFYMSCPTPTIASNSLQSALDSETESKAVVVHGGGYYSDNCDTSRLRYVLLPSTLWYMGSSVINPYVDTIESRAIEPPTLGGSFVNNILQHTQLFVPCGSLQAYLDYRDTMWYGYGSYQPVHGWGYMQHVTEHLPYDLQITVNEDTMGTVEWICGDGGVVITATPAEGHHFLQWSDGLEDTIRTIVLTSDSILEAIFAWGTLYDVAVSSTDASRGTVYGSGTFVQESIDTLTATPLYGYHFASWSDGDTANPRYLTVLSDTVLTASFVPNQYTIYVSSTNDEQGSVSGGGSFDYNTDHPIYATPTYGYHFSSWNDGDTTNPRDIHVTRDTAFSASFSINVYTINVSPEDTAMGDALVDNTSFEHGTTATLTATANYGYHFASWSDGDTTNPRMLQVTQDTSISAHFAPNQYSVAAIADEARGSIDGTGLYNYLSPATITATPAYGYHFASWNDGDTTNPRTLTVTEDTAFTAIFLPNEYTLQLLPSDASIGSTYGSGTYYYLDTVQIGIAAIAPHYHFTSWSDGSTDSARTVVVTSDSTITANFSIDQHSLTLLANDGNFGNVTGANTYDYGSTASISATPATGYYFVMWDNGETDNPCSVTILGDTTVTAVFAPVLDGSLYMVSVENGHNTLVWKSEPSAVQYRVMRESSVAGEYEQLCEIEAGGTLTWVDSSSNPETRSYRYRLQAVDNWGTTFTGTPHKTMHLTINRGHGGRWNLVWSEYEGTEFVTYIIYRGTSPTDMAEIDRMPVSGNTSYTDANPPTGDVYYQIGIVPATPLNVTSKSTDVILSNIEVSSNASINAAELPSLHVIVDGRNIIVRDANGHTVRLYDVAGRSLAIQKDAMGELRFTVPAAGAYIIKADGLEAQKVIVIR